MNLREQLKISAETGKCNHPAHMVIMLKDDNWDEHLPVKEMLYCTKCKTEPENIDLLRERTIIPVIKVNARTGVITAKTFKFPESQSFKTKNKMKK